MAKSGVNSHISRILSYLTYSNGSPNRILFLILQLRSQGVCDIKLTFPFNETVPFSLFISPKIALIRLDLPEPNYPIIATNSPFLIINLSIFNCTFSGFSGYYYLVGEEGGGNFYNSI